MISGIWNTWHRSCKCVIFLGRICGDGASEHHGLIGDNADGVAIDAPESADHGRSEQGADFKKRVLVQNKIENLAHVVCALVVGWNDLEKILFPAVDGIIGAYAGRKLPNIVGHIAQEALDGLEGFFFRLDKIVNDASLAGLYGAAKFFLGKLYAHGAFDKGRSASENLRRMIHDHAEVAEHGAYGGTARTRSHDRRNDGHFPGKHAGLNHHVLAGSLL